MQTKLLELHAKMVLYEFWSNNDFETTEEHMRRLQLSKTESFHARLTGFDTHIHSNCYEHESVTTARYLRHKINTVYIQHQYYTQYSHFN